MFSLKLSSATPTLTLGNAPSGTLISLVNWHKILNPYFWSFKLVSASINNVFEFKLTTKMAVIDSAISNFILPQVEFRQLINWLRKDMICA